jgi:hypothetical protein
MLGVFGRGREREDELGSSRGMGAEAPSMVE